MNNFAKCLKHKEILKINSKQTSNQFISKIRVLASINFERKNHSNSNTAKEVEHHAKLASEWWDKTGSMKPLHSLNELRVPFIRDGLITNNLNHINSKGMLDGFQILEVGCGGGILTEALAYLHANVTGIDLGKELIAVAEEHSNSLNNRVKNLLTYKVESVEDHAKENKLKYDAIILSEVIEHIDNKVDFMDNCIQTLKRGGSIFITTPNKTTLSYLGVIGIAEYFAKIIPKGTHTYDKFITPTDMQRILDSFNCSTILINGMFYDFLSNKWKWTSCKDFCYALQAIKID